MLSYKTANLCVTDGLCWLVETIRASCFLVETITDQLSTIRTLYATHKKTITHIQRQ